MGGVCWSVRLPRISQWSLALLQEICFGFKEPLRGTSKAASRKFTSELAEVICLGTSCLEGNHCASFEEGCRLPRSQAPTVRPSNHDLLAVCFYPRLFSITGFSVSEGVPSCGSNEVLDPHFWGEVEKTSGQGCLERQSIASLEGGCVREGCLRTRGGRSRFSRMVSRAGIVYTNAVLS